MKQKTLKELDEDLVDVVWGLLDYTDIPEIGKITESLDILEEKLDEIINADVEEMSEVESRFSA